MAGVATAILRADVVEDVVVEEVVIDDLVTEEVVMEEVEVGRGRTIEAGVT